MSANGELAIEHIGQPRGPRLVLLHGFTQTREHWRHLADRWASEYDVILVDLPGHGDSGELAWDLRQTAAALADRCDPAIYVGYSLGGRVALHVAAFHRHAVVGLVTIGATAGIDKAGDRTERRNADAALADSMRTDGIDAFLQRWLAGPLFATLHSTPSDLAARRANTVNGLAASLTLCGTGSQDPLWSALADAGIDALVMAGQRDEKFCALGQRLAQTLGATARFHAIETAGHAAHLEQPAAVGAQIDEFLAAIRRPPAQR